MRSCLLEHSKWRPNGESLKREAVGSQHIPDWSRPYTTRRALFDLPTISCRGPHCGSASVQIESQMSLRDTLPCCRPPGSYGGHGSCKLNSPECLQCVARGLTGQAMAPWYLNRGALNQASIEMSPGAVVFGNGPFVKPTRHSSRYRWRYVISNPMRVFALMGTDLHQFSARSILTLPLPVEGLHDCREASWRVNPLTTRSTDTHPPCHKREDASAYILARGV